MRLGRRDLAIFPILTEIPKMRRLIENTMRIDRFNHAAVLVGLLTIANAVVVSPAMALEVEGFTEPYRTVNVASGETGIIAEVLVREGDVVEAGQPLARLNNEVHKALLAIAEKSMKAKGKIDSALAELSLRKERFNKLKTLRAEGHARQEELDRARAEVEIAEGNVTSVREDLLIKKLDYAKINAQLVQRTIRSPFDGVVTTLHKEKGEFVAPNSPEVLTLVELDSLLAHFSIMSSEAKRLSIGQKVQIRFPASVQNAERVVESIAPVTDAESGTVQVKVRIANPKGSFRSGERCMMRLPSNSPAPQAKLSPSKRVGRLPKNDQRF